MPLALSAALLVAAPVYAQNAAPPFTCETWNAAKPQFGQPPASAGARHLSWVMDYIAARDREPDRDYYGGQIDLTDGVDASEVTAWMNTYCTAHRSDTLAQAAAALVGDLGARWVASHAGPTGR